MDPIALICSVEAEMDPLLRLASSADRLPASNLNAWAALLSGRRVIVVVAGMGKTNAARALTALLERTSVAGVIGFGVGGAYPRSGLRVGDLAIASGEHYGDEGVETPSGWISCEGIGIPLVERGSKRYFNDLPVDERALAAALEALAAAGLGSTVGPFVTVSACSGTAARGAQLGSRYEAICETMEGAAYAHIAAFYGDPFIEVRGISNLVEDRDMTRWKIGEGAEAAAAALPPIVQAWPYETRPTEAEQP